MNVHMNITTRWWSKWPAGAMHQHTEFHRSHDLAPTGHHAQMACVSLMTISSMAWGARVHVTHPWMFDNAEATICCHLTVVSYVRHIFLCQQVTIVWNKWDTEAKRIWVFRQLSCSWPWFLCRIESAAQLRLHKHDNTWCSCFDTASPHHQV